MHQPSRRDFLRVTTTGLLSAAGLLGLGGLLRFLDFETEGPAKTVFDAGEAANYAQGSRTVLADIPALLISGPGGLRAMSLVCTHLGCTVEAGEDGFKCPCHGSQFTADGAVRRGPARLPLRKLRVETSQDGHVLIHTD